MAEELTVDVVLKTHSNLKELRNSAFDTIHANRNTIRKFEAEVAPMLVDAASNDSLLIGGITVVERAHMPDGFCLMTSNGRAIGVIDLNKGTVTTVTA